MSRANRVLDFPGEAIDPEATAASRQPTESVVVCHGCDRIRIQGDWIFSESILVLPPRHQEDVLCPSCAQKAAAPDATDD